MPKKVKLSEISKVLRSKNAGPFLTTIDIFCENDENYEAIKKSGVLNKSEVSRVFKIPKEDVLGVYFYNQVKGIKITMVKPGHVVSGDIKCADTLGMQQYIPLKDIAIPGCL